MQQKPAPTVSTPQGPAGPLAKPAALGLIALVLLLLALLGARPTSSPETDQASYYNPHYGFALQLPTGWQEKYQVEETADRIYIRPAESSAWQVEVMATNIHHQLPPANYTLLGQTRLFVLSYQSHPTKQALPAELAAALTDPAAIQEYTPHLDPVMKESFSRRQLDTLSQLAETAETGYADFLAELPWHEHLLHWQNSSETLALEYDAAALTGISELVVGDLSRHIASALLILRPELIEVAFVFPDELGNAQQTGYTREGCTQYYGSYLGTLAQEPQTWLDCIRTLPELGRPRELGAFTTPVAVKTVQATELRQAPLSSSPSLLTLMPNQTVQLLAAAGDYLLAAATQNGRPGYVLKSALDLTDLSGYQQQ